MDDHRAQTLQALEAFIQTQRTLLARQQSDIERLQRLRVDLVQRPTEVLKNLSNELDDNAFRMSEQADCRLKLPKEIEWSVFEKSDTGPLRTFAQATKDEITQRTRPSLFQRSDLSDLQRFVKQAKCTIIDPILSRFADMSEPEPESSEDELDPFELRRQQEQQKIRELKKRRIRGGGLSLPLSSRAGSMGVFIRHDVGEEAMAADVSIDDGVDDANRGSSSVVPAAADMDIDAPAPQASSLVDPSPAVTVKPSSGAGSRVRRLSKTKKNGLSLSHSIPTAGQDDASCVHARLAPSLSDTSNPHSNLTPRPRTKKVRLKLPLRKPILEDDDEGTSSPAEGDEYESSMTPTTTTTTTKKNSRAGKPKPETYKQAWTESEQNLLEQLLEEIPDGEKNRWQKISIAMGGRRTPRQVASRVQKYFEKLKKFGIGIGGG